MINNNNLNTDNPNFQDRFLLNLESDKNITNKILRSPLGLASEITKLLFNNNFDALRDRLDDIKGYAAGINRADQLGNHYSLARLYPYLFSFHQYVHSSYRARQGKALEELLKEIMRSSGARVRVADKESDKKELLAKVIPKYDSKLDLDIVARNQSGETIVVQLRSRDDTGGTTAKSSLVEALRYMLTDFKHNENKLLYMVGIWESIDSNQKRITVQKIHSSLETHIRPSISADKFEAGIEAGIEVVGGITLQLAHGKNSIIDTIAQWVDKSSQSIHSLMLKETNKLDCSDDFWLAYTIVSLELENNHLKNQSNTKHLQALLKGKNRKLNNCRTSQDFVNLANSLALDITPRWHQDSLPLTTLSEKMHYVRDLILLKFVYDVSSN